MNLRHHLDESYYQQLHENNPAFMNNNWMTDELDKIKALSEKDSLLEMGCGNGRFLELAARHWSHVTGVDWARSPRIDEIERSHDNVTFIQADVTKLDIQTRFSALVSADFLEHLREEDLPVVISMMLAAADVNYHKIACYDDGHSHLSIFPPDYWTALFCRLSQGHDIRVIHQEYRKGNPNNIIITIAAIGPRP